MARCDWTIDGTLHVRLMKCWAGFPDRLRLLSDWTVLVCPSGGPPPPSGVDFNRCNVQRLEGSVVFAHVENHSVLSFISV